MKQERLRLLTLETANRVIDETGEQHISKLCGPIPILAR